jgi:hypothetical protein
MSKYFASLAANQIAENGSRDLTHWRTWTVIYRIVSPAPIRVRNAVWMMQIFDQDTTKATQPIRFGEPLTCRQRLVTPPFLAFLSMVTIY